MFVHVHITYVLHGVGGGGMNIFLNRDKVRITYCVSFANLVWKMNHVFALNIFSPNPSLETPKLFKY